jgi:uncharacterized membrane protein YqjE
MKEKIIENAMTAVIVSLLLGIIGQVWNTYNEVRELRHDVNQLSKDLKELRGDLDGLWAETSDQVQRLDVPHRRH